MNAILVAKSRWRVVFIVAAVACLPASKSKPDEAVKAAPAIADSMVGKKPGQVRDDNGLKMKLVWCPPGNVTMEQVEIVEEAVTTEDEDEAAPKTRRVEKITPVRVLLSRGYWLGVYEVTQSKWMQVMPIGHWKGKRSTKDGADFPATFIRWDDAVDFCQKLTVREREAGRLSADWEYTLPTEAQWERACRARTETKFSFGDDELKLSDYAWFRDNVKQLREGYAHQVGQKKPNPWGLYDMHGNVWEWCRDWYQVKLPGGRDPEMTKSSPYRARVVRGGSWFDVAGNCRSIGRSGYDWPYRNHNIGFRVALSVVRQAKPDGPEGKSPSTLDK